MEWRRQDDRRTGSVRATIDVHGERILDGSSSLKKPQVDSPESSSRAKELHMARRDLGRYRDSRRAADSVKAKAESELFTAKKTVKELTSQIEESNSKAKAKMRNIDALKKSGGRGEKAVMAVGNIESHQNVEVMRELKCVKQELSKLKLEMASVLEEKAQAEKKFEESSLKLWSNSGSVDALRKDIHAANEEQVLVELARIEALREHAEIEAQTEEEASEFSFTMEETKKKMKDANEEIELSKELEHKFIVTLSDVRVLQNELMLIKEMDKRVQRTDSLKQSDDSFRSLEELESSPLLLPITEELEAAKKELALVREEGFQFMASMDIIRIELKHVTEEISRLKKTEEKTDMKVQSLNSKLLRAKSKLEAATAAEEKARSIVTSISLSLEQLKTEAEVLKKQKALAVEETATVKTEIRKTESEIDLAEERLQAAMQELEAVKSSEALALQKLKSLIENTMQGRTSASQKNSKITISKFEYEYLTGRAVGAEEIADKKVAAAQAWVEALKASEREILIKTEIAQRELREMRMEEEKVVFKTERSLSAKRKVERELFSWRKKSEKMIEAERMGSTFPRKSSKSSRNSTPSRRGKFEKSASPATPKARSTPIFLKKKRKVMPNLAKFFGGKRTEEVR
ncbi:hypothetical protein SLEP1_g27332 [Rubroshorea leprosula]|uniref:Protein PLASTID MOVEMENT IMPAIRED 2 n=1 Tax=Rubroshorea leprosula TaxID=152421 RepID=A0AAV5JPX8_9ROSI|nr:hypothetical protein SLEP1_g27332 [Rubroshorea leprosula]